MASSSPRNGASDRAPTPDAMVGKRRTPDGQPLWLAWLQLSISSMLVVLFLVMLAKVREQAVTIGELEQKVRTIENGRSQDRTTAMEQQLESMIQRLQSVEQVGAQLREVNQQQQALKQDLQQLRSSPNPILDNPGRLPGQATKPARPSSLPAAPRPSATVLRPPDDNF